MPTPIKAPNGSRYALLRPNMNYQPAPGAAYQPVDLNFHAGGGAMVEDHSAVTVKVSSAGIDTTDRETGAGVRVVTPSLPSVAGNLAKVPIGGLTWNFAATGAGMSFSSIVPSHRGLRTYAFDLQFLGGMKAFSVDPGGNLVSNGLRLTRASVVTADGRPMAAGSWSVLPGGLVAFSFDDSVLQGSQFPYVIDPALQFSAHANNGQSYVANSSSYPPASGITTYDGTDWVAVIDDAGYSVGDFALTWNTSPVPSTAVGTAGFAALGICLGSPVPTDANMRLNADWITNQGLGPALYPTTSPAMSPNALNPNAALQLIPAGFSAANAAGCISGTTGDDGNYFWLLCPICG